MDYRLKILKGISMECMECLNKDVKKKKEQILYIRGGNNQISTGAKLLDIKYEFCGFNGDLMDAIN